MTVSVQTNGQFSFQLDKDLSKTVMWSVDCGLYAGYISNLTGKYAISQLMRHRQVLSSLL